MHDLFDKLGAASKRAAGHVATKVSVAAEKQKLSDAYRDLGKRYYQAMKAGEAADLSAEVAKIDEALARIDALNDRRDVTNVRPEPEVTVEDVPTADEPDFIIVEE